MQLPLVILQIIFLCITTIFLVATYFFIRSRKFIRLGFCAILVTSLGFFTYTVYTDVTAKKIMIAHEISMYAGPDTEYHQLTTLPAETLVTVLEHKNNWTKIMWKKNIGWVADTEFGIQQ